MLCLRNIYVEEICIEGVQIKFPIKNNRNKNFVNKRPINNMKRKDKHDQNKTTQGDVVYVKNRKQLEKGCRSGNGNNKQVPT